MEMDVCYCYRFQRKFSIRPTLKFTFAITFDSIFTFNFECLIFVMYLSECFVLSMEFYFSRVISAKCLFSAREILHSFSLFRKENPKKSIPQRLEFFFPIFVFVKVVPLVLNFIFLSFVYRFLV